MELRHLRYFVALTEELHFGRAADRLSITQSPLSAAIQALEGELGVQLFERTSKHVRMTPAGAAFLIEVRSILQQVKLAGETAQSIAAGMRGRLDIGFTGSMIYRQVPAIITTFKRQFPSIDVNLREMSTSEQINALSRGELDAGFANSMTIPGGLAGAPLPNDELLCCLPEAHPFSMQKSIDLRLLADEPFIMFAREAAPANYDNVIAICTKFGFNPKTQHAVRQWLTVVALVAQGLGVALVPGSMAKAGINGARFIPLAGKNSEMKAFVLWNEEPRTATLPTFLQVVHEFLKVH